MKLTLPILSSYPLSTLVAIATAVAVGYFVTTTGPKLPFIPKDSPTRALPPWIIAKPMMALAELIRYATLVTTPPQFQALEMITSSWKSEVLYMLVYHGVFDVLAEPKTCTDVATVLDLKEDHLLEFMRAGHGLGLLKKNSKTQTYSLSATGALFQSNVVGSLKAMALHLNSEHRDALRAGAVVSPKTGTSGFEEAFGEPEYDWMDKHPVQGAQFDKALKAFASVTAGGILGDWTPPKQDAVFCDIGGGGGQLTAIILEHYPAMTGIVFDLPSAVARAEELFDTKGIANRTSVVGGSFFDSNGLPEELEKADVFFLRQIIHNWDDEACVKILKNIKAVAKPGARVVIAEQIFDTAGPTVEMYKSLVSVNMKAALDAKERSFDEFKQLLEFAGFDKTPSLILLRDLFSLVEVVV